MTMPNGSVLIEPMLDAALRKDGYVVVDLLEVDELTGIRAAQRVLQGSDDSGLTIDFARSDRRAMHEIHDLLAPMWARHLPRLFHSYRPVVSTFVVKHPGPESEMLLHNEPTFVDPALGPCFNVWIPLVDVDASLDNGLLELVPGSQRLPFGLAGFDTPVLFRPFERYIRDFAVPLSARAGQAVIYDTRMLHASQPNRSDEPRPAIAAAMAPIGVPLIHVVAAGRYQRDIYQVDEAFFLDHHPMEVHAAIADRYRMVDRRRDGSSFSGSDVAVALGGTIIPAPEVVMPSDVSEALKEAITPALHLDEVPGFSESEVGSGLDVGALTEVAPTEGWRLEQDHGISRLAPLAHEDRSRGGVLTTAVGAVPGAAGCRMALVMERGARARLVGDVQGLVLVVVDAAMVSAGILLDGRVAQLEPGRRVELVNGSALLWNDGACPLVIAVVEPSQSSGISRARRFLRRVRTVRRDQRRV